MSRIDGGTSDHSEAMGGGVVGDRGDADDGDAGLESCLEALLIASDGPLRPADAARILGVSADRVDEALSSLSRDYDGGGSCGGRVRGFALRRMTRGWQLVSRPEYASLVSRLSGSGPSAVLSSAALEALAIIAYKQPMTRAQVSAIRGVGSDGVIRMLIVRDLVEERGEDAETHAALLSTTDEFLDRMGMSSLDQLPDLAPLLPDSAQDALRWDPR